MKILYYDCFAGISGDMNLGALIDLGVDRDYLITMLKKMPIRDEFEIAFKTVQKMGITATKADVIVRNQSVEKNTEPHEHSHSHDHKHSHDHDHTHSHKKDHDHSKKSDHVHRNLQDIEEIIDQSAWPERIQSMSKKIFRTIAKAEAKVHGKPIDEVHFHEVGAVDSIVDIAGAAICIDWLKPDRIVCSCVELGGGFVQCAHGRIPVPAPATVEILQGVPVKTGAVSSELTTPTGAAIIKALAQEYTDIMSFQIEKIGYGAGTKDFDIPNVLRVYLARKADTCAEFEEAFDFETNTMIETNIDDMSPEHLAYAEEKLFDAGALDVYRTPIVMKKGRSAVKLNVLCHTHTSSSVEHALFIHTSTFGLRSYPVTKKMLKRETEHVQTKYGEIPIKKALYEGRVLKSKPEYDVYSKIADTFGVSIRDVLEAVCDTSMESES